MGRFSPSGVGEYSGRPNYLAQALSDFADRYSQRRREKEALASRAADMEARRMEAETGRSFDREMAGLAEQNAVARDTRREGYDLARDTRREEFDIAREQRAIAARDAERAAAVQRYSTGLMSGLRGDLSNLGNADQAMRPGALEDIQGVQGMIATGDPELLRSAVVDRQLQPGRDARELGMYRQKAAIDASYRPPPAPRRPDTMMVGGRPYMVGGNGQLVPMTLPDGSAPPTGTAGGGARLPLSALNELAAMQTAIGQIDEVIGVQSSGEMSRALGGTTGEDRGLLGSRPESVGRRFLGPRLLLPSGLEGKAINAMDPGGADVRASLSDISSRIRKDRLGGAITLTEYRTLEPLLAEPDDTPEVARDKLNRLRVNVERLMNAKRDVYRGAGYAVPGGAAATEDSYGSQLDRLLEEQ